MVIANVLIWQILTNLHSQLLFYLYTFFKFESELLKVVFVLMIVLLCSRSKYLTLKNSFKMPRNVLKHCMPTTVVRHVMHCFVL